MPRFPLPVLTAVALLIPFTVTGLVVGAPEVFPVPSWPCWPRPQQSIEPVLSTAQANPHPALTALALLIPETVTGSKLGKAETVPFPSSPSTSLPQQETVPPPATAQPVLKPLRLTCFTPVSGRETAAVTPDTPGPAPIPPVLL